MNIENLKQKILEVQQKAGVLLETTPKSKLIIGAFVVGFVVGAILV